MFHVYSPSQITFARYFRTIFTAPAVYISVNKVVSNFNLTNISRS